MEAIQETSKDFDKANAAIKEAYDDFLKEKDKIKRKHREEIGLILRDMDERKIKELKEKFKDL